MRRNKGIWKKAGALLLAAALVMPALQPVYAYAQEDSGQEQERTALPEGETDITPVDETAEKNVQETEQEKTDTVQKTETPEENSQVKAETSKQNEVTADKEEEQKKEEEKEQASEDEQQTREGQQENVKITGIELSLNGQNCNGKVVHPGDNVEIKVTTEKPENIDANLEVVFRLAGLNAWESEAIQLTEADKGTYIGGFEIKETDSPCEWYMSHITIREGEQLYEHNLRNGYPYYVNVAKDDSVNQNMNVTVFIHKLDADAVWNGTVVAEKNNVGRRMSLKELGVKLPEMSSEVEGLTQIGWVDDYGNDITEDTKLLLNEYSGYLYIFPKYDKILAEANYSYVGTDNVWKTVKKMHIMERGSTYEDLWKKTETYMPGDMMGKYTFEKWDILNRHSTLKDELLDQKQNFYCQLTAQYKDVKMLRLYKSYYDNRGQSAGGMASTPVAFAVKGNVSSIEEAEKQLKKESVPELYEGLRFKEWQISFSSGTLEDGMKVSMTAMYENYIVRYWLAPRWGEGSELVGCEVAEKGDTFKVPSGFEGYGKVTWTTKPVELKDNTFVVGEPEIEGHAYDFSGYGEGTGTDGGTEETPEKPETPDKPETPNEPEAPVELPQNTIKDIVNMVNRAKEGGDPVIVHMGAATVVPEEILEAAKGKDIELQFKMDGYTWTINGKNIYADNLKDINLEVKFDTNAVPGDIVKELAGNNPTKQLSLTHNGAFGFKATLTMNAGKEHSGKYGNLYYYNNEGKMTFMNAGRIGKDGNVSVDFSHASDYVLVMNDKIMGQKTNEKTGTVKTGDTANAVPYAAAMLLCVGICGIVIKKRYSAK